MADHIDPTNPSALKAPRLNLTGRQVGCWTVVRPVPRPEGRKQSSIYWLCICRCGSDAIIEAGRLNAGRGGRACRTCFGHGATRKSNGTAYGMTSEYQSWRGMRERCINPSHKSYPNYGGRGIAVCDRWLRSFDAFLTDMGSRPKDCSLDRIDNSGDYEASNCRWADRQTQARNSRRFKLSDEQVVAIRAMLATGARQVDVALIAGVARSHIANIATGRAR
jgi:hypothetical protein